MKVKFTSIIIFYIKPNVLAADKLISYCGNELAIIIIICRSYLGNLSDNVHKTLILLMKICSASY